MRTTTTTTMVFVLQMTATVTFCVMSICCAAVQFAIGVVAAVNDHSRSETGELSRERYYLRNDIYYERNDPFHYLYSDYCTHTDGAFTWVCRHSSTTTTTTISV